MLPSIIAGLVAAGLGGLFNGLMIARFRIQPDCHYVDPHDCREEACLKSYLENFPVSFYYTTLSTLGAYKVGGLIPLFKSSLCWLSSMVMGFIVKTTVFARHVEAIGDNYRASKLSGIDIPFVIIGVYVLCGALSGLAGIMEAARINSVNAASLGLMVELDAIAAVAIGGTPFTGGKARILGTVLGCSHRPAGNHYCKHE